MISSTKANSLKLINKYNKRLVPSFFYFEKKFFLKNKLKLIKKIKKYLIISII